MIPLDADGATTRWLAAHRTPLADRLSHALMWLGTPGWGLAVAVLVVVVLAWWRRRRVVIALVWLAGALATVVGDALKAWVGRPRPAPPLRVVDAVGSSMPSTSAAVSMAVLVVMGLLAPRQRWRRTVTVALAALQLAVCWAIVYLGAHWLSDVCAGTLLGLLLGLGLRRLPGMLRARRSAASVAS